MAASASAQDILFLKPNASGWEVCLFDKKFLIPLWNLFLKILLNKLNRLIGLWFGGCSLSPFLNKDVIFATFKQTGKAQLYYIHWIFWQGKVVK